MLFSSIFIFLFSLLWLSFQKGRHSDGDLFEFVDDGQCGKGKEKRCVAHFVLSVAFWFGSSPFILLFIFPFHSPFAFFNFLQAIQLSSFLRDSSHFLLRPSAILHFRPQFPFPKNIYNLNNNLFLFLFPKCFQKRSFCLVSWKTIAYYNILRNNFTIKRWEALVFLLIFGLLLFV